MLPLIVSAVTLLVAYFQAGGSLPPLAYVGWPVASFFVCMTFVGQNTVEGCFILILSFLLLLAATTYAPRHILYPLAAGILTSWIVTRIQRRHQDGMPWIE
ncbi:MAG: hypothetical protein EOP88_22005 [Verrucomicrobiaceae bacterium]|nr:MAG: hypothetical protein EOP88_22005 [Verrucomicrobiaceae bacterium]